MSYSIRVRGPKADVKRLFAEAFARDVLAHQKVHEKDRAPVQAAVDGFVDALDPSTAQEIQVSANGSLAWSGIEADQGVFSIDAHVSAALVPKTAP